MNKKIVFIVAIIYFVSFNHSMAQKDSIKTFGRSINVFPYPFRHYTFVQTIYDRQNINNADYFSSYTIRAAKTFSKNFHLRAELPLANTNTSGRNIFGMADVKLRLLHAIPLDKQLYAGYGAELTLPTATDASLGSGKWQGRPEVGLIYFLGKPNNVTGTITLGVDYRFDFAGTTTREHVSVLGISPNIDYWAKRWYLGYYATWTYNFNNDILDIPIDLEFGYTIIPHFTLAAEYIQPLIKKRTYNNEYAFKLRYLF